MSADPRMPVCPRCGSTLDARLPDRRFIENNNYVECAAGHVWQLADPDLGLPRHPVFSNPEPRSHHAT